MSSLDVVPVTKATYLKAKEYLPEHWVIVLFKNTTLSSQDKPTYVFYRLIASDKSVVDKIKTDITSKYDSTHVGAFGTVSLMLIFLLSVIKFVIISNTPVEITLAVLIFIITSVHIYVRCELLRVKKEYAIAIIEDLSR